MSLPAKSSESEKHLRTLHLEQLHIFYEGQQAEVALLPGSTEALVLISELWIWGSPGSLARGALILYLFLGNCGQFVWQLSETA